MLNFNNFLPHKHHIFASIHCSGLFKTKNTEIRLLGISTSNAWFKISERIFDNTLGEKIVVELWLNGKLLKYEARVIEQDTINNLYAIEFTQIVKEIDDYLSDLKNSPRYGVKSHLASSVWANFEAM